MRFSMVPSYELSPLAVERVIDMALDEDLGAGDLTTEACIDADALATARCVARGALVVCGGTVFARTFRRLDPTLKIDVHLPDGERAPAGACVWTVAGRARSILMGERVALNFVQRMSGIASRTREFVDAVPFGAALRIIDTRKTTPGLRALERYSVRVGGGHNHRDNLGSAILIKDNHIAACGSIVQAIQRARALAPHTARIECEVDTLEQMEQALDAGADIVLLDNMSTATMTEAVLRARGRAVLEASGNVTVERIPELARAGIDVVSVGALTHSVRAADLGLDFSP